MNKIPVVILDTIGDPSVLHRVYREKLSHVEFSGTEVPWYHSNSYHPHGVHCGWDAFSQTLKPIACHFIRAFNEDGRSVVNDFRHWQWVFDDIRKFRNKYPEERLRLNMSWGGGPDPMWEKWSDIFVQLLKDLKADAHFAAGNSGHENTEHPQIELAERLTREDTSDVHIIGACDANGFPASFTSSGNRVTQRYADHMFRGVHKYHLNGLTGTVDVSNGTSFSCPSDLGDALATGDYGQERKDNIRKYNLSDKNKNGIPDGVAIAFKEVIQNGGYHTIAGTGCPDKKRQENQKETGLILSTGPNLQGLEVSPKWHDYDLIS